PVPVHPKQERNQTGSGMYHPIVKEQVIPGQLEGLQTNRHSTDPPSKCQALIPVENSATCGFLVTSLRHNFLTISYTDGAVVDSPIGVQSQNAADRPQSRIPTRAAKISLICR